MTGPQSSRLREIALSISLARRHPSPAVREAFAAFSDEECENALRRIEYVLSVDNGQLAYKVIEAWHRPGSEKNVVTFLNGMFPVASKVN